MAQQPAARSATGRTRPPLRWIPWLAILLLFLVAALIWILVANIDDDDDAATRAATGDAYRTTVLVA